MVKFTSAPDPTQPITFGIIGDVGQTQYSRETLGYLQSDGSIDAILHAGDLSYADSNQTRWDTWGSLIQPLARSIPLMVTCGNHEIEQETLSPEQDAPPPFLAYQSRFFMPSQESHATKGNLYYSFSFGMVHTIVLNPYIPFDEFSTQYQWLERDLEQQYFTSRDDRWIIVMMHGPWYNSNKGHQNQTHEPQFQMKESMESLLYQYKVDLVISGHVHAYERTFPVYQNQRQFDAPIYLVIGDAGNREGLSGDYLDPAPAWSAFRKARYGYGKMRVMNATHAFFEWHEDTATASITKDSVWWIRTPEMRVRQQAPHHSAIYQEQWSLLTQER